MYVVRWDLNVPAARCLTLALSYSFRLTLQRITSLFPTCFQNVAAVALETDITFPAVEKLKAYLEDPSAFAAAAPAPETGSEEEAAEKQEEKKEEEEEEESDDDMGFGLFD